MKILVLTIMVMVACPSKAQEFILRGTIKLSDTTDIHIAIPYVVKNDSIQKIYRSTPSKHSNYADIDDRVSKVEKDTTITAYANILGEFSIPVKKSDTLYFQANRGGTRMYENKAIPVAKLISEKRVEIVLNKIPCKPYVENICGTVATKQFLFIGKRINVVPEEEEHICNMGNLSSKFKATYQILASYSDGFKKDTIVFNSFDHYGSPPFRMYPYSLLLVEQYCDRFYMQKRIFLPVFPTKSGKWATPESVGNLLKTDSTKYPFKPIAFLEDEWIDVSHRPHSFRLPTSISNGMLQRENLQIPIKGVYVDDFIDQIKTLQ